MTTDENGLYRAGVVRELAGGFHCFRQERAQELIQGRECSLKHRFGMLRNSGPLRRGIGHVAQVVADSGALPCHVS